MPVYEEKPFAKGYAALFFCLVFVALYSIYQLHERELRWDEGYYAAMAAEMNLLKPGTQAQGEMISSFPLFPWMVALLYKVGFGYELGLRLISVLSVAALAIICWEAGRRSLDDEAGLIAAAAVMTFLLVIEKSLDGYPDALGNVFVVSAWLVWFTLGAGQGRWNAAWFFAMLFCGLAFYTTGWHAMFYCALPFIFLRRPLTIWSRLRKPGFLAGLAVLAGFVLFWGIPRWSVGTDIPFRQMPIESTSLSDYFGQLVVFPFEFFLRFLPWSALAWPAFCPAYHPIEKNPVFNRFLRTIFYSLFFMFWITPSVNWREMTILAAPLAILTASNYWLLVRRHGRMITSVLNFCLLPASIASFAILAFYAIPIHWIDDLIPLEKGMSFHETHKIAGIIQASAAILVIALIKNRRFPQIWATITLLCLAGALCYWALFAPFQALDQDNRTMAEKIRSKIPADILARTVIYKERDIGGLYAPCLYLNCKVRKLKESLKEIPASEKVVYLLASNYPTTPERNWENLTQKPLAVRRDAKLYLWKGTLITAGALKTQEKKSEEKAPDMNTQEPRGNHKSPE